MSRMRRLVKRYERWLMILLLLIVLVIFTVTDQIVAALGGAGGEEGRVSQSELAGSFEVLPGERVDVTWEEYNRAFNRYRVAAMLQSGGQGRNPKDTEVWAHLLLLAAAEREGITVGDAALVEFLRGALGGLLEDKQRYNEFVARLGMSRAEFEEAVRDLLITSRVRELYRDSYLLAPPDPRAEMVEQYTAQNLEYTRVSWAALDAAPYLDDARKALEEESDPGAALKAFFEKDPAVTADQLRFRHPRRYKIEVLYTIHRNVLTEEAYRRVEEVFGRTWPELDLARLEPPARDMDDYYQIYTDRLLEQAGYAEGLEDPDLDEGVETPDEPGDEGEEPGDGPGEGGEPAEGDDPAGGETPAEKKAREERLRRARRERGFEICREQIDRELRIRGMYQWFHTKAREDEDRSLEAIYDLLKEHDDPDHPVLTTEPQPAPKEGEPFDPNRPIIVYRAFEDPLSGDELEDLEDSGVRFTHNFRHRITSTGDKDLPKVGAKADVLGMAGHGRMIWRVIAVEGQRRKTYDELTPAEREELKEDFYLPHAARERAKEALAGLRTKIEAGDVAAEDFPEAARSLGARVYTDEWITAGYGLVSEPEKSLYWEAEFEHMRDRHFLRRQLASLLAADRVKKEIGEGDFLDVQVNSRSDAADPGAAYLVRVLERRRPTAETMPEDEFATYAGYAARRRDARERERWTEKIEILISDFGMEFYGPMQERVEEELRLRREAERRQ